MCGICGIIYYGDKIPNRIIEYQLKTAFSELFKSIRIRGTDASGLMVLKENYIYTYKNHVPTDKLLEEKDAKDILDTIQMGTRTKAIIGHARAQTKGDSMYNENNHPIIVDKVVGIHNGIIKNDDVIFEVNNLSRRGQVDSEVIFRLLNDYLKMGKSIIESVKFMAARVIGSMACAFIYSDNPRYITLFRDTSYAGLTLRIYKQEKLMVFASTKDLLDNLNSYQLFYPGNKSGEIELNNSIVRIDVETGKIFKTTMIGS